MGHFCKMIRSIKRPILRQVINSVIGTLTTSSTVGGGFVDPVPGWLFHYLMDGNDRALTPVMSPTIVSGLELPDQLATLFNGVDQYYASTDGTAIATIGTGAFTLSFWMNSSDPAGNHATIATGVGTASDDFRLRTTNSAKLQFRSGGAAVVTPTSIVANTDYLVTIDSSGSGGTLNIYLNNVLDKTAISPPYNFNNASKTLYVGTVNAGSQLWGGKLDAIRLYPFVLSAAQRLLLLNNV